MKLKNILIMLSLLSINSTYAAIMPGHILDVIYDWPQPQYSVDINFKANVLPSVESYYYWSHFFVFKNSVADFDSSSARTGYAGIQTLGKDSKIAIFSIWNSIAAQGAQCDKFGGEGIGYNCKIPYSFKVGGSYRVRVWQLSTDSSGDWWGAWIRDNTTKSEKLIGQIKTRPNSGLIIQSFLFDEYFISLPSCTSMPRASMSYFSLLGNNSTIKPKFVSKVPGGPCKNYLNYLQGVGISANDFTASTPK